MAVTGASRSASAPSDLQAVLRELNGETILLVLPALFVLGFPLLVLTGRLPDPSRATDCSLAAFWLAVGVWALGRRSQLAAAWLLVVGGIGLDLLVMDRLALGAAVSLLALPAGLAALFVSIPGGLLTATGCSLLLLYAHSALIPAGNDLRTTAFIGVWATVGLIWLTLRPLTTALQWSWSSYEQSRDLLEQARDQRLQLKQALDDLADANLQLTRLNRLAQGLRQLAEDARRAKEQFVANVSHELRTPLNMVIGFTETILQAPESYGVGIPSALLADLAVILRNSQHLSALIDDVLDLSQIEAGQMALTKEWVELAEVAEAAALAVQPLFVSKGLYLRTRIPPDLPPVFCDRTRVREVLLNLLSNAGRFTAQGGVEVQAWRKDGEVVVSVADTGPGIASGDRERLFRPFEQLDGTIRRRFGGTGLGLAISKSFVELHGGEMWLESEMGRGTTFFFRLPIEPPLPADGAATHWLRPGWEYEQRTRRPASPRPAVRPRLVVAEAGYSLTRLLNRYAAGAEVVRAASVEAALQELAQVPAQALVVNAVSTSEAMERLSELGGLPEGTPAIVCSVPGTHEAAGALGVADYLLKPVSREALLAALDRLSLTGGAVLVVDDDAETARLFRRMLHSYARGFRVLTASSAREGLALLREQRPDVLLLDLMMPEIDGFELLAQKGREPAIQAIPVIVISASDPMGRPIVTNAVTISRGGGLSIPLLLACIEAIGGTGSLAAPPGDPAPRAALPA